MKDKPLPQEKRVTEKQLSYLKSLMTKKEFSFIEKKRLSKYEASFMIRSLIRQKLNEKRIPPQP